MTDHTPIPSPVKPRRSSAARVAILDAAFQLVGELGYGRLTMESIAARAGVGKQTIYRWWPSKGAVLLEAVVARSLGDGPTAASLPDSGDIDADLVTVMRATVAEFSDGEFAAPLRALTIAVLEDPRLAEEYARTVEEPTRNAKRERLESAQRAGQLSADLDLELAMDLIWSPVTQRWLFGSGELDAAFADDLVRRSLAGLRDGTGTS